MKELRAALAEKAGNILLPDTIDVDTAIARGAALHAHNLATKGASISTFISGTQQAASTTNMAKELTGVLNRGVGVRARDAKQGRDVIVNLVPQGTKIPFKQNKTFKTSKAYQTSIEVYLYEGEETDPDECEKLGKVEITGFEPGPAGTPVSVSIEIDQNGSKHLIVAALGQKRESVIEFDPTRVVSIDDMPKRKGFISSLIIV